MSFFHATPSLPKCVRCIHFVACPVGEFLLCSECGHQIREFDEACVAVRNLCEQAGANEQLSKGKRDRFAQLGSTIQQGLIEDMTELTFELSCIE